MLNIPITSRSHQAIKRAVEIRDGKNPELLFCEGWNLCREAVLSGMQMTDIFCAKDQRDHLKDFLGSFDNRSLSIYSLIPPVMEFISDLSSPPGIVMILKRPQYHTSQHKPQASAPPFYLLVHELQLPQNVGALIRTGEAAGVNEVHTTNKTADPFGPKALRASAGSCFRLPIFTNHDLHTILQKFRTTGIMVFAAAQDGELNFDEADLTGSTAIMLGSESHGIPKDCRQLIQNVIKIPMDGKIESLNVAAAGAILMYEAKKQRNKGPAPHGIKK